LNIKFRGNAKFLEVRPIRVVWMALNVEWCNEKKRKKKKKRFKVVGHTRGEERKGEELMIFLFN
jgi:hypothetical protein